MSLRNIRKIYGGNTLPKPDDSSEDEYEPLYAKNSVKPQFSNLLLSSPSESVEESPELNESEYSEEVEVEKVKKKKKKGRKNKKSKGRGGLKLEGSEEMDEIDKSVMEVNALLGKPPPATPPKPEVKIDIAQVLFGVNIRNLNVTYELRRLFGPEVDDEVKRTRGRVPNLRRCQKPVIIPKASDFLRSEGPSMSLKSRENGYSYFIFDHSREYQKKHLTFLMLTDQRVGNSTFTSIDGSFMHVEARLEAADFLFFGEEYSMGNTLIEQIIAYMQSVFHPSFNLGDRKTRLEYKYIENRPFHIAILKYIHLLTNKACHRTALELAKVLLNLDPTDPLAVLFIIDNLALRAREHQWLVDAVAYWSKERDAEYMFNIQYSNAMAKYHLALKDCSIDKREACELLQRAILRFPLVALKLLEIVNESEHSRLAGHPLFRIPSEQQMSKNIRDLYYLYASFTSSRWREPSILEWFVSTVVETAELYNKEVEIQEEAKRLANQCSNLFRQIPDQVQRHICVIRSMSNLLVEGAVMPDVPLTRFSDPIPPITTVDRYGYARLSSNYSKLQRFLGWDSDAQRNFQVNLEDEENRRPGSLGALITSFFTSLQINEQLGNVNANALEDTDDSDFD
ncbi:unnamed protein product [Parnassius apollo]|uniref:(apollo) hypothetical protein n=1 Tax=Parnassius apollo TaxID=110799 RepID=A0A8S3WIX5_PARAO|nr:unnamed protein product [Parnassius apollo]